MSSELGQRVPGNDRASQGDSGPTSTRILITGGSGFIGTNLTQSYTTAGASVLNIDTAQPHLTPRDGAWVPIDILDRAALIEAFRHFEPQHVVHLAARTDLDERRDTAGYRANVEGVENVIAAVRAIPSVERTVFASSRLVCRIGYTPRHDTDYCPTTLYGASKVRGEELVRAVGDEFPPWAIVRPTSIWGPWFGVPYRLLFELIERGRYFLSGGRNPRKSFGYVGNTVHQLQSILGAPAGDVHGRTYWLADPPIRLQEWTEQIRTALDAPRIRRLPMPALATAARVGDFLSKAGWRNPPITTFRLDNMVTDMVYDTSATDAVAGELPFSMEEALAATVGWLRKTRGLPMDTGPARDSL